MYHCWSTLFILWSHGFVKKWLCEEIADQEICVPGYQLSCRDQNRQAWGRCYAKNQFRVNVLPCHHEFEILPVTIHHLSSTFCIGVLLPPSSPDSIFDTPSIFIASMIYECSSVFSFVLVGILMSICRIHYIHCIIRFAVWCIFTLSKAVTDATHITETDWDALASEDIDHHCSQWWNTYLYHEAMQFQRKFFHLEDVTAHGMAHQDLDSVNA